MSFNLFGCNLKVSFWFLAFITGVIMIDGSNELLLGVLAAIFHELGHIFAMILNKDRPSEIKFGLFDIAIIDSNRNNRNFSGDLFILFFGPATNYILALVFYIMFKITYIDIFILFSTQNFLLGVLNSLPIESLDGGQILYIFLTRFVYEERAQIVLELISFLFLLPLACAGFYILLQSKYNFSLLLVSLYLIVLLFTKKNDFY